MSFLKIGIIFASLHRSGEIPVLNDRLIMSVNLLEKKLFEIFKMYTGILLGPNDFFISKAEMML